MPVTVCKCGCGAPVYAASKSGFLRGHNPLRTAPPAPQQPEEPTEAEAPDPEAATAIPEYIECCMTGAQLDRIWATLSLREKAVAVLTALEQTAA